MGKPADDWYNKHWKGKETEAFLKWWSATYGSAEDYGNDLGEQEDYYLRKGFALMGWLAAQNLYDVIV
jgi:hypothetical protein